VVTEVGSEQRPLFVSFDDAWSWFASGGHLETLAARRERFTQGRAQFLSFQAPIISPDALALIETMRDTLSDLDGVVPVADEHLHISIRGAGFQVLQKHHPDEILRQDTGAVGERAARTLRGVKPIETTIGPINVFPDALVLEVHEHGELAAMRASLNEAVGDGDTLIDDAHYLPHVTIATFESPDVKGVLRELLGGLRSALPASVTLRRIDFARWWFTGFDERESTELEVVRSYVLR
jgi:2'-5' RNA ligase